MPLVQVEQQYVQWAADHCDGNLSAVARELGVSRSTVYRILKSVAESA